MKISQKLILGFAGTALLIGVVGYISVNTSQRELQKNIGESSVLLATEILDKIDRSIYSRIEEFQSYAKDLILQEVVVKSNQEFDQLYNIQAYIDEKDAEWISAPKETLTPFMQELINNRLSEELIEKIEFYEEKYGYEIFGEVFVTNKYGANVAQTGKTSDYRQDDEEWWQNVKKDGLYVGDVKYDKSADVYSTDICIRINDEVGNFLGVMKVVLNIEEIINILKELEPTAIDEKHKTHGHESHKTMGFKLLTKDGKIIYSTEEFEFFQDIYNETIARFGKIEDPEHVRYFIGPADMPGEEGEELFAHAHSRGYKDFKGLGWFLVVEHKTEEIFAPVTKLRNSLLMISASILIIAILIGLFISRAISLPIIKLKDAAVKIGKAEFDTKIEIHSKDEIGFLAQTFNEMVDNLKTTTTSIDNLKKEIVERQKAEEALQESEERLRLALSAAEMGTWKWDAVKNQDTRGATFNRILGLGAKETTQPVEDFLQRVHPDDRTAVDEEIQRSIREHDSYIAEFRIVRPDGSIRWLRDQGKPFYDEHGQVSYMTGAVIDITERKKLEEELEEYHKHLEKLVEERTAELKQTHLQLIQSEKMKVIGTMASGIAHDVKNPLGIIVQGINYLENKFSKADKSTSETMQMIKDNISRADNIVRSLVNFSRSSELTLKPEDINSVLETSLTLIKHRIKVKELEIIKELGKSLPKALVDSGKMEQVFVNLLINAGHAMPNGGKLFVRSYLIQVSKAGNRRGNRSGDYFKLGEKAIVIEIEDTGIGISEDNLKRIFDPFFTTKEVGKGTGLGLLIVKNIIDLHRGLIEVESKVGSGTKFIITLKIAEA